MMAIAVLAAGCSSEYRYVHGTVTADGQPLTKGRIRFHPSEGRPASGHIAADGTYTLTTIDPGDGAKPGDYAVTIEARETETKGEMPKSLQQEMAGVGANTQTRSRSLIHPKYSIKSTSGLTATVEDSGSNEINFNLTE